MKNSQWPSDEEVPGFRKTTSQFMAKCERISDQVLSCLSVALGFEEDYFRKAMDVNAEDSLTQLRLLHYMASEKGAAGTWRAGTHTDIGCLTLLFQRDGEDGLEICPGRESCHSYGIGDTFTPLSAETGPIVVNIGDMLSELPPATPCLPPPPPPKRSSFPLQIDLGADFSPLFLKHSGMVR